MQRATDSPGIACFSAKYTPKRQSRATLIQASISSISPSELVFTVTSCSGRRSEQLGAFAAGPIGREPREGVGTSPDSIREVTPFVQFPDRSPEKEPEKPQLVRVRLSVHYRVHSRQLLCIGGSQIPFGWSFLSIAKLPMEWNPGDLWTTEVKPAAFLLYIAGVAIQHWTRHNVARCTT